MNSYAKHEDLTFTEDGWVPSHPEPDQPQPKSVWDRHTFITGMSNWHCLLVILVSAAALFVAFAACGLGNWYTFGEEPSAAPQLAAAPVAGKKAKEKQRYIKVEKDVALKTAIVTFDKGPVQVTLVAAVHFGDRAYYRALNSRFKMYDPVLYELVGPPNAKPNKEQSLMANLARILMDLESQVQRINYNAQNFVHADLDWGGMMAEVKKRGDTELSFGLRVVADLIKKNNTDDKSDQAGVAIALATAKTPLDLKRALALQFNNVKGLGMPSVDEVIVSDRNKAAIRVLEKQLEAGKQSIAIFYGAAHMEDMENRLRSLGFGISHVEWITAWDLQDEDLQDE